MKSKSKKLVSFLLRLGCCAAATTAFVGCDKDKAETPDDAFRQAYALYTAYAESNGDTPATYEEWLKAIKGEKGDKGEKGEKGDKGDKGDTGATGAQGAQGEKGQQGEKGDTGAAGKDGKDGQNGQQGEKGDKGDTGVGIAKIEIEYVYENGEQYAIYKIYYTNRTEPQIVKVALPRKVTHIYAKDTCVALSDPSPEIKFGVGYESGKDGEILVTEDMYVVDKVNGYVKPNFNQIGTYSVLVSYQGCTAPANVYVISDGEYIANAQTNLTEMLNELKAFMQAEAPETVAEGTENYKMFAALQQKLDSCGSVTEMKEIAKEIFAFEAKLYADYAETLLNEAFALLSEESRTKYEAEYKQKIAAMKLGGDFNTVASSGEEIDEYLTAIYIKDGGSIENLKAEVWGDLGAKYNAASFKYVEVKSFERSVENLWNNLNGCETLCMILNWKVQKKDVAEQLEKIIAQQQESGVKVDLETYRGNAINSITAAAANFASGLTEEQQTKLGKAITKIGEAADEAALDAAIAEYYALQKSMIGTDYLPSQGGSENPDPENPDEDLERYKNDSLNKMNEQWTELEQQGADVKKYADMFKELCNAVQNAGNAGEVSDYMEKFQNLCSEVAKGIGGGSGEQGGEETPEASLTAEEWNAAMALDFDYSLSFVESGSSGESVTGEYTFCGNLAKEVIGENENYLERDGENYYLYAKQEEKWVKSSTTKESFGLVAPFKISDWLSDKMGEFQYNGSNTFYCDCLKFEIIVSAEGDSQLVIMKNITVIFTEDKKVSSVSCEMSAGSESKEVVRLMMSFDYSKKTIELPQVEE